MLVLIVAYHSKQQNSTYSASVRLSSNCFPAKISLSVFVRVVRQLCVGVRLQQHATTNKNKLTLIWRYPLLQTQPSQYRVICCHYCRRTLSWILLFTMSIVSLASTSSVMVFPISKRQEPKSQVTNDIRPQQHSAKKTPVNVLTKICILSWPFEYIYILGAVFRTRNRSGVFLRTRLIGKSTLSCSWVCSLTLVIWCIRCVI